jgi:hypothetical protein
VVKRDVRLARYDVRTGWLPRICPRHGVPATGRRRHQFTSKTPAWVWLLIVVAWLIAVIVAAAIAKHERAQMPTCGQCDRDRLRFRVARYALGLGGLLVAFVGIQADSVLLGLVGSVACLIWLLSWLDDAKRLYAVRGCVVDDHWLDLRDVHPAFVAALAPNPAWAMPQPQAVAPGYLWGASYPR